MSKNIILEINLPIQKLVQKIEVITHKNGNYKKTSLNENINQIFESQLDGDKLDSFLINNYIQDVIAVLQVRLSAYLESIVFDEENIKIVLNMPCNWQTNTANLLKQAIDDYIVYTVISEIFAIMANVDTTIFTNLADRANSNIITSIHKRATLMRSLDLQSTRFNCPEEQIIIIL